MSRAKYAVKFAWIADEPMMRKYQAQRYGENCDPDALDAIQALHNSIFLGGTGEGPTSKATNSQIHTEHRDRFFEYIKTKYRESWASHDGSFFRKLADAMEVNQKPVQPAHTVFIGEIRYRERQGIPAPTISEMHQRIADAEIIQTRKTTERLFKLYKVTPGKDKPGPEPGTKQKSVHRRHRS